MSYQKFYTNPIQSSSLLCQLASMWKNDVMCDAIITAGDISTKVRNVKLVMYYRPVVLENQTKKSLPVTLAIEFLRSENTPVRD